MILPRFPFPLEKGDKLRAFHHIKVLSQKHDVSLFCITSQKLTVEQIQALSPYCKELCWYQPTKIELALNIAHKGLLAGLSFFLPHHTQRPLQNAFFFFRKAKQKLQNFIADVHPDHLFFQLVRMIDYADDTMKIPKTLDYQDAFSLNMLRRAERAKFPMKSVYRSEYKRMKTAETKAFDRFDYKMIISESDRKHIAHPKRDEILIVKNGIDLDFFKADPDTQKTIDLLFVGNLSYPPNAEAVRILKDEIMPKLLRKNLSVKLLIAGANPPQKWLKEQSQNVQILPNPKDIREAYRVAKIFVAPMVSGSGLQNKLLEAMAMKLPCITTELANAGLQATPDKNILIAKTPDEFVEQILYLQAHSDVYEQISEHAFEFVSNSFSWAKELDKWLNQISPNALEYV